MQFLTYWLIHDLKIGSFPAYLSILAVAENEAFCLAEWIEYHHLVGVEKFWITENDSTDNTTDILQPYCTLGSATLSHAHGRNVQADAYNRWLPIIRNLTFWLAVIDIDEFLVPVVDRSVAGILSRFELFDAVRVNWLVYGSNFHEKREVGLVLERFPYHSHWNWGKNRHVKIIVNPRVAVSVSIHTARYRRNGGLVDVLGCRIDENKSTGSPTHQVLHLNHYGTKSEEEFGIKRARGLAIHFTPRHEEQLRNRLVQDFHSMHDVIQNDTTIDWAIPIVKANIAMRFKEN
jgi:hypothetical protein